MRWLCVAALTVALPAAIEGKPRPKAPRMIAVADLSFESASGKAPWRLVTAQSVRFGGSVKVKVGDAVTAVPLDPKLPPIRLSITGVRKLEWAPRVNEIDLSPLSGEAFTDASGDAGEVLIVYPASPTARHMSGDAIRERSKRRLPRRFTGAHVEWGVDVDGDGEPDALMLRYCTEDRTKPECHEATASVIYRWSFRQWVRVFTFEPVS